MNNATLTVHFDGQWFLFDAGTEIYINNKLHSKQSTKQGFKVTIPIQKETIEIKIVLAKIKTSTYLLEELDISKSYDFQLYYDNMRGRYSKKYKLTENA